MPCSKSLQDRMNNEAEGADPEVLARFRAEHGGMSPLEYALSLFPEAAAEMAKGFPLVAPKDWGGA